jgi:hypothetical protein
MDEFPFDDEDVISVNSDGQGTQLKKIRSFKDSIDGHLRYVAPRLFLEGIECEVLSTNGGGWKKGRVRLRLEYIPDEPTE